MRNLYKPVARLIVLSLCPLLLIQPVEAQQTGMKIIIVEGANARNAVQQIAPRPLIVQVSDATNRPVAGAIVTFTAPETGPTGEFDNDSGVIRVSTDNNGTANAGSFHPNAITGAYHIQVRAEYQGQTAAASIAQTNIAQRGGHGKLITILAISGAAVAAAFVAHDKWWKDDPATVPTITFGGAAVGAPNR